MEQREFHIEGTSFNPNAGAVKGLKALDKNLEVGGLPPMPNTRSSWGPERSIAWFYRSQYKSSITSCGVCCCSVAFVCHITCRQYLHKYSPLLPECAVITLAYRFKEVVTCAQAIAEVCAVCNEARIECREGTFKAAGAPTEAALIVLAEKLGVPDQATSSSLAAARRSDPDGHPDAVQQWYNARSAHAWLVCCMR